MYNIPLDKLYKIWFNKDKDQFLDEENKLRFIRMREKNPGATISFLYCKYLLSSSALADMEKFCKQHKIQAVSLESFKDKLTGDERALFTILFEELQSWRDDKGGNPAAASDIARILTPIMDQLGIYSDFDVEVDFSKLESSVPHKGCILLSPSRAIITVSNGNRSISYPINNEFIACARDEAGNLHKDALDFIKGLQASIVAAYSDGAAHLLYDVNEFSYKDGNLFKEFGYNDTMGEKGIIEFRRFLLQKFDELSLTKEERFKMFKLTVMSYTGPDAFIQYMYANGFTYSDYCKNDMLRKHVISGNQFGAPTNDASWIQGPAEAKERRIEKMDEAAKIIQKAWRDYKCRTAGSIQKG